MSARRVVAALLLLPALMLAACGATPAAPEPGTAAANVTVAVQTSLATVVVTAAPQPTHATGPTQGPSSAASPTPPTRVPATPRVTRTPAASRTPATAAPSPEPRVVELEWPEQMRLGDSEIVRVALNPGRDGYVVTTEFPGHEVVTETVPVPQRAGYDLAAVARLTGVGFAFEPEGEQLRALNVTEPVSWRWTVTPRAAGRQSLAVVVSLRWTPQDAGGALPARETLIYSKGLAVDVTAFMGLSTRETALMGFAALVLGGVLGLPLALYALQRRPKVVGLPAVSPNAALALECPPGWVLGAEEEALLRALFRRYARVTLEAEFRSGYSGARTFLALPVRADGRADAYTIAKLGERAAIAREQANYETFVKDTLPPVTARIQEPPVVLPGRGVLGALRYTFIGEPGRTPVSLRAALVAHPDPALLEQLFATFGPNWWLQRAPYTFRLAEEYDRLLPAHLVLEPVSGRGAGHVLEGHSAPGALEVSVGEVVALRDWHIAERRPDGQWLALAGTPPAGQPALRARWLGSGFAPGAAARVVATRATLLREAVAGLSLDGLPDPFARLAALLEERVMGSRSIIHGDLNLENVLVGPGGMVWLIDFAATREGHPLFDFAHLAAEVVAHVLAPRGAEYDPRDPLLAALARMAAKCLFNPEQPREYELALAVACVGALKHANLDAAARRALYLAAARIVAQL